MDYALRVGIVADWTRSARGNFWEDLLRTIQDRMPTAVTVYPIADLIVMPPQDDGQARLSEIYNQDVLIINWDAGNGDPEFGAHLVHRWLEHRRPEILLWIQTGKILIVESQTTFGVPSQSAYDATVGPGEVYVSGLPNADNPLSFRKRLGAECIKTKYFPKSTFFDRVDSPL
jgi:hypothetical protein